jgi:hypothetical protein
MHNFKKLVHAFLAHHDVSPISFYLSESNIILDETLLHMMQFNKLHKPSMSV